MGMLEQKAAEILKGWDRKGPAFFYVDPRHGVIFEPQVKVSKHEAPFYDGFIDGDGNILSVEQVIDDQIDSLFEEVAVA